MSVEERLKNRLQNVSGVTDADIEAWVSEAKHEADLTEAENADAVFYLALTIAYEFIATNAANYFKYTDGEESVDKSMVFDNYLKLAEQARKQYRKYRRGRGASQTHVGRADCR